MKKVLSLFLICIICCGVRAQRTEVYNQHIHTVQVIANNDYMSPAVIRLGENETVEISFDHLTHDYHRYQYTAMRTGHLRIFPKQNIWTVSMTIR